MDCADERIKKEVDEILNEFTEDKDNLITILNEVQIKYGYIPKVAQIEIANYLNLALAEVYGVITFYSRFTLVPKGKYNVSICLGTACFVKGSREILERAKAKLGIMPRSRRITASSLLSRWPISPRSVKTKRRSIAS